MKRLLFLALGLLLGATSAYAQNPVLQSGTVTRNHAAKWIDHETVQDAGPASGGGPSVGISDLPLVGTGTPLCIYDAPVTNSLGYHSLCLGANDSSFGKIIYSSGGGAAPLPFEICVNGSCLSIPSITSGSPRTSVPNNSALMAELTTAFPDGVWRNTFASGGNAPPLFYKPSASACSLNSGNGDNGSQVKSADGNCWLAVFPAEGVDVRQFGADSTGTNDSRPAINAAFALGSNKTYIFPEGTYTIKSIAASPYPLVAGPVGLQLLGTTSAHLSNIRIKGHNAIITADSSNNNSNWMAIDYIDHLEIDGLTFQANKVGMPASASPSVIIAWHLSDFSIRNIRVSGDWGGATYNPAFIRGNWWLRGEISNIHLPKVGQCIDGAYWQSVSISNMHAVGAGDASGAANFPCISIAYDNAMQTNYPPAAPYNFITTRNISIGPGNDISNFEQALALSSGQKYQIFGNSLHDNPGHASGPHPSGAGILIHYQTAACCVSAPDPVLNVAITGNNIADNATSVSGAGIILDTSLSTGAAFGNYNIAGNTISNNKSAGINAVTSANLNNVFTGSNAFAGLLQTTLIAPNVPKSGEPPAEWVPADISGAGLTFTSVSARYELQNTLVHLYFSITYPTTANTSNAAIQGMPYFVANALYGYSPTLCWSSALGAPVMGRAMQNTDQFAFYNAATGANLTNANLTGQQIQCQLTYPAL